MAQDFFDTIAASGGFACEYVEILEADFAGVPSGVYVPGEDGVFRLVASRTEQVLMGCPMFIETFQTSAATLRMPAGLIATNDANDGRIFYIKNAAIAIGNLTVQDHLGVVLGIVTPGDLVQLLHADNNDWNFSSDADFTYYRYSNNNRIPAAGTRYMRTGQGIRCSEAGDLLPADFTLKTITIANDIIEASNTYNIEVISDPTGTPIVEATLTLNTGIRTLSGDFNVAIPANTEIGVRIVRVAGSGRSDFRKTNITVVLERD